MMQFRVLTLAVCLASTPVFALDQGESRFNGFGTAGLTHLGGEDDSHGFGQNGQTTDGWRGDQLSKLGGQFQYGLTDTVGFTAQVLAKAQSDQWQVRPEWLYLSWQTTDDLMVRAGKLGSPIYMYSETINVGFTNPWLRLPEEVYHQVQTTSYRGVDAVYTQPLSFGSLTYQVGTGQSTDEKNYILPVDQDARIDFKNALFANVTLATHDFGSLRLGYAQGHLHGNKTALVQPPSGPPVEQTFVRVTGNKGAFTSLGYQFDNGKWAVAAESTKRSTHSDGRDETDAFYTMLGRHFGDFLAHVTYAQLDDDFGRESSWTYGLNYTVLPTVVVKGEFKRVDVSGGAYGVFSRTAQETVDNAYFDSSGGAVGSPARNFDGDIISVGVDFVF